MMTAAKDERPSRERTYSITELCREFNVTPRTLRFYEQKGLLSPARRGWTRLFSYRDRARLQLILRGKRVGFALEEIKEMLDLYNLRDGQVTQLKVASVKMRERLNRIIARETGQSYEKVENDTDRNFWIGAEDAVGYGLVSRVVTRADEV